MTIYRWIFHEITGVSDNVVEKIKTRCVSNNGFQNHSVYERNKKHPADLDKTYMKNAMWNKRMRFACRVINPLNAELNSICYLLALLGAHHFLHVSRIRVKTKQRHWIVIYNNYCFSLGEIWRLRCILDGGQFQQNVYNHNIKHLLLYIWL